MRGLRFYACEYSTFKFLFYNKKNKKHYLHPNSNTIHMKTNPLFGLLLLAGLLFAQTANTQDIRTLYRNAMSNAVYPDSSKIDNKLVPITAKNPDLIWKTFKGEPHVLMVTWKSVSYYPDGGDSLYNTGPYSIWVTAAPQLKSWFQKQQVTDTNLRLKQLLGLPPAGTNYTCFVEFWVKPSDMFRPCPDKEINDRSCSTCFPDDASKEYISWFNESRISRYYACKLYDQYPWTQLGYTYDWNPQNKTHVGMSEFVINKNAVVYVKRVSTTREYLAR